LPTNWSGRIRCGKSVHNHGKRSKWINLFAGRQIAFSMMEILK
jgi:hypothetical protein